MYYSTMESMGFHKRDILADRVESARDAQVDSKQQFKSSLERFTKELNFSGGDLEKKYETLNREYEASLDEAENVSERIDKVESVAAALFDEWQDEIAQYTNASLKRSSQLKLTQTRSEYRKLIKAMKRTEAKMAPVLAAFKDQVLYLKHNLNARAIASLKGELGKLESNVSRLINDMETSIKEADSFIRKLSDE